MLSTIYLHVDILFNKVCFCFDNYLLKSLWQHVRVNAYANGYACSFLLCALSFIYFCWPCLDSRNKHRILCWLFWRHLILYPLIICTVNMLDLVGNYISELYTKKKKKKIYIYIYIYISQNK